MQQSADLSQVVREGCPIHFWLDVPADRELVAFSNGAGGSGSDVHDQHHALNGVARGTPMTLLRCQ